jgi:hypothetical protein
MECIEELKGSVALKEKIQSAFHTGPFNNVDDMAAKVCSFISKKY